MRRAVENLVFRFLGKDPEAVVATFFTGESETARRMWDEIRSLIPDRPHLAVRPEDYRGLSGWQTCRAVWRWCRSRHIGMAAVLFTTETEYRWLRLAAFLVAPTRVLAYNARGERHHLRLRTLLASYLFLRGVPLDRIFVRPRWFCLWRRDRPVVYGSSTDIEGRPPGAGCRRVATVTPNLPWPLSHCGAVRKFHPPRGASSEFDVDVRAAAAADLPAIARIQQFSPDSAQWDPPSYLKLDCRVAVTAAGVAGFIVARAIAEGEWEILNLAVDPPHRRRGLAETLVREVLKGASGAVFLEVRHSNRPARRLYEKAGFVEVGLRENYYSGPAEAAIVMRLQS